MSWDFTTEPEFQRELDWIRAFIRAEVWPLESIVDELDQVGLDAAIRPLQARVKQRGLWAAHLGPELGGQGFGQVKLAMMQELIGTAPLAMVVFGCQAPDSGNSEILAMAGTPEQKERWLEPLLAGEIRSAFSLTEPDTAGSDPTLLATRATRDTDGWVIDGHKWFTSNGSIADLLIVMAVTDPDAEPYGRATMFLVPADAPGVHILRDVGTMAHPHVEYGRWGNHTEVRYEGVRVGPDAVLGEVGGGFAIAQHRLGPGRIHHCMRWLGQAQRALDMLCERATYRYAHGGVLADKGTVQDWIADSAAQLHAARLMTLHAAWVMDTQGPAAARTQIGMIKYFGAQVLHDVIDRAIQAHGSLGYSSDLPLEEMYRHARAARIYDGPDEVHRQSVARRVLRGYTPPSDGVPTEHLPTRRATAREKFADLLIATTE